MEYEYQGLDPGSKVQYILNGIRCDKLSTAVATVRVHQDKYEKDFNAVVAFVTQYVSKRVPTPSVKVSSVAQTRPAKQQKTSTTHGNFKGKIELKKYSREECGSMSTAQHQQLCELPKKSGLVNGKQTPESSRALMARVAMIEAKTDNSCNKSLFTDEKPKANNRNSQAFERKGSSTRQIHADTWLSGPSKGVGQPSVLRDSYVKPLSTIQAMVAHASLASSKLKVELDSHADTCVVGDNCLIIHDHNGPVNVYSYDPKDGHRRAKTVDAAVGNQDPQSGQKFILMIDQAICIDGLENHPLCCSVIWMMCILMKSKWDYSYYIIS